MSNFNGFSDELFTFFRDLEKNNNRNWFQENKIRYDEFLVKPAKAFVEAIAPFFNNLDPQIRTAPKFNQTLMRINHDMRFHKGNPYRTYFLIHFGKFKLDSEFYVYFDSSSVQTGLFINNSTKGKNYFKRNALQFRKEIENVFTEYKLNNNYSLFKLEKEPVLLKTRINIQKHLDLLLNEKMILIQKVKPPTKIKLHSASFLPATMKIFHNLFPLYCFAVSPEPLKKIKHFEDYSWEIL